MEEALLITDSAHRDIPRAVLAEVIVRWIATEAPLDLPWSTDGQWRAAARTGVLVNRHGSGKIPA
jgi:hypothetical protein